MGDHRAIRALIASGADPNQAAAVRLSAGGVDEHVTPLMLAARSAEGASVETLRLLMELGADAKVVAGGRSAAMVAALGIRRGDAPDGDAARLGVLLEAGSPLDLEGEAGALVVCSVARLGDAERLSMLISRGAPIDAVWEPGKADQSAAEMGESLAVAEEDQQRWASAPWSHEIPLFCAAESGSAECLRLLIDAGADPFVRDNSQCTAMFHAASVEVIRALVALGLSLEDRNRYGWSPLDVAVDDGNAARVGLLIQAGADVNATHDRGYTVFMSAVASAGRTREILELLVAAGADPHAVSELGYHAFHAAIDVFGRDANSEVSVRETLTYLKTLGVDIDRRTTSGRTPLALAIDEGTAVEAQVLCDLGADPNAPSVFHRCGEGACSLTAELPLFGAARTAYEPDLKTAALLEAGADPLARDAGGNTALELAVGELCADTEDPEEACSRFFAQLRALKNDPQLRRDRSTASLRVATRQLVETFAAPIPIRGDDDSGRERRAEQIGIVALLAAHDWSAEPQEP